MYKHSTFGEVIKLIDKKMFAELVKSHKSDKYNKGFNTWHQLVAMLFAQLSPSRSLRDLETGFNAGSKSHYHMGAVEVRRSTLSYVNKNRDYKVFQDIAGKLIAIGNKKIKEMNDLVSLIDSSPIRIDGRGSDWTKETQTARGKGLKLHVQASSGSRVIEIATITSTNVNDITEAKSFNLEAGKIYVFDKGYMDFNWWHKIDLIGSYFVTRIKKNTSYKIIKERDITGCAKGVTRDCLIRLTNKNPRGGKQNLLSGKDLRLVEVYNKEQDIVYYFISNLLEVSADDIGDYYKQRWGIELLFKWLKQNLKIKKLLAENENAIKIQIYVAIIAYILIGLLKELYAGFFKRNIDLLSWIRATLFCSSAPLRPPRQKARTSVTEMAP